MANQLVNMRDQSFVLFEQLGIDKLTQSEVFSGFSKDDLVAVLKEAEKLAVNVLEPAYKAGDAGCKFDKGVVNVPPAFHDLWKAYAEGGWIAPSESPDVGGQGLPLSIGFAVLELMGAANYAFSMYPGLTHGAAGLIHSFGTEAQKQKYMFKLYSGEWGGTMCLTEPGAGSDVGALKTTAKRLPDGKFLITGTKCFISSGEHDLTPNIVHPVLARIEGDPAGTRGISCFIVPKIRVNDDGSLGERNDVTCVGIEHKMGIKGSATAMLAFGEEGKCVGELLGGEREGLKVMFQMMNESRLGIGMQGLDHASAAYEHALAYAKERVQGTSLMDMKNPDAKSVTIINHPDIRRRLLWIKSHVEGLRALAYFTAYCFDMAKVSKTPEEQANWAGLTDLLTPIVKAYTTDKGFLLCSMAMDVYGGYGYCAEYPVEQYLRDEKIGTIYEGTNGIQALDLVGRKIGQRKGANMMFFMGMVMKNIAANKEHAELGKTAGLLEDGVNALVALTMYLAQIGKTADFVIPILNANKILEIFGDVFLGHFLLEAGALASKKLADLYAAKGAADPKAQRKLQREDKEAAYLAGKVASAKYFIAEVVTTVKARCEAIKLNDKTCVEMVEEAF